MSHLRVKKGFKLMGDFFISHVLIALRSLGNAMSFGGRLQFLQSIFRRLFRLVKREVVVTDFDGTFRMQLRLSEHMQRRIFWMGYYSTDIVALLKRELRQDMVVVDVGANIGEISLVAAQRVGVAGKVIAFEPVSAIAERLTEHVQMNDLSQVIIRREALGKAGSGRMPIYGSCGQDASEENLGLASLYGERAGQNPIEYVDVITLDDALASLSLARVDLIKIDVEGGELACLQGAGGVLRRFRPMLIVEVQAFSARQAGWNVDELFQYLQGFGYVFFTIDCSGFKFIDRFSECILQGARGSEG
jgi:FkbM family methyltransferase